MSWPLISPLMRSSRAARRFSTPARRTPFDGLLRRRADSDCEPCRRVCQGRVVDRALCQPIEGRHMRTLRGHGVVVLVAAACAAAAHATIAGAQVARGCWGRRGVPGRPCSAPRRRACPARRRCRRALPVAAGAVLETHRSARERPR